MNKSEAVILHELRTMGICFLPLGWVAVAVSRVEVKEAVDPIQQDTYAEEGISIDWHLFNMVLKEHYIFKTMGELIQESLIAVGEAVPAGPIKRGE